jgi:hypothetical protein
MNLANQVAYAIEMEIKIIQFINFDLKIDE